MRTMTTHQKIDQPLGAVDDDQQSGFVLHTAFDQISTTKGSVRPEEMQHRLTHRPTTKKHGPENHT